MLLIKICGLLQFINGYESMQNKIVHSVIKYIYSNLASTWCMIVRNMSHFFFFLLDYNIISIVTAVTYFFAITALLELFMF